MPIFSFKVFHHVFSLINKNIAENPDNFYLPFQNETVAHRKTIRILILIAYEVLVSEKYIKQIQTSQGILIKSPEKIVAYVKTLIQEKHFKDIKLPRMFSELF